MKDITLKDSVRYVYREFQNRSHYLNQIELKAKEIEAIELEMIGVSSPYIKDVVIENKKPYSLERINKLIERKEELVKYRNGFIERLTEVDIWYSKLSADIKPIVNDYCFKHMRIEEVASRYNYSTGNIPKKIYSEIEKILQKDKEENFY